MESFKQTLDQAIRNEVPPIEEYQFIKKYKLNKLVKIRKQWLELEHRQNEHIFLFK